MTTTASAPPSDNGAQGSSRAVLGVFLERTEQLDLIARAIDDWQSDKLSPRSTSILVAGSATSIVSTFTLVELVHGNLTNSIFTASLFGGLGA